MSRRERIVIVGAGLCGLRAAERLRELGFEGDVVIVGDEAAPPYHRPALSKQLLLGTMKPDELLLPAYQNVQAKWRLNTPVQYLLPRSRTLRLPGDEELKYDGLIIATGVEARRQNEVPYDDPRILVLRTMSDALDMERVLSENRGPVAVVGGGFTGCELASSLRHMGREVTLIGRGKNLLGNVLGADLGDWMTKLHADHGVDLVLGNSVKRWAPREDGIAMQLADGSTMLVACVLLATGTVPSTAWLRGSGLPLDNGVVCEATTHVVGAEDVVAAGDVAQWPNIRFDTVPRRIEHWLNAIEMGRAAAENLLAGRAAATPFTPMPRFWTEQHGVRIQAAGVPKLGKEIVSLGGPSDGTLVGYAKDGRLMGVVGVDCPKSVLAWTDSVARQNPVPGERAAPAAERPVRVERSATRMAPAERSATRMAPPPMPAAPAQPAPAPTAQATPAPAPAPAPAPQAVSTGSRRAVPAPEKPRVRGFAAKAEQRKGGRHSLPPKEPRRPQTRSVDRADPVSPAAPVGPAAASSAQMMPVEPPDQRLRNRGGGLIDSAGRPVAARGPVDVGEDLASRFAGPAGPTDSFPQMQPPANGRVVQPPGRGPAAPNARMGPPGGGMVPGGRGGPEDSYDRHPAVPPINEQLRSMSRMRPVDPRRGPEASFNGMPPAGRGPVDSNGGMRPPNARPGPADSYPGMPPAGQPVNGPAGPPVDSYTRLPPVHTGPYERPQLNLRPWNGNGPGGQYGSAVDSYTAVPPVGPPGPFGPVGSDGRLPAVNSYPGMPPVGRQYGPEGADEYGQFPPVNRQYGPEDSYDQFPPVNRQYGPEDSYDRYPPAGQGPVGPQQRRHA